METVDLEFIYSQLKAKYALILTNAFSLDAGFTEDCKVLTGKAEAGKFHLYNDGSLAIFSVENEEGTAGTHWHPCDNEDAINDVAEFMEGKCKYELQSFPQPMP